MRIRTRAALDATVVGLGQPGDGITRGERGVTGPPVVCANGDTNSFWIEITNNRTRVRGWVSFCYVSWR